MNPVGGNEKAEKRYLCRMMRVAVCDEDISVLEYIREQVVRVWGKGQFDGYEEPSSLIKALKFGRHFRLVIMGMEWGRDCGDKGIEAARQVQELNPEIRIICMAEQPERYIQQIFLESVNIFGFLTKPIEEEILNRYFKKAQEEEMMTPNNCLLIRNKGAMQSVQFDDILYLESEGHTVMVQTREGSHCCYGRLDKFIDQLPEHFIQCHKSYLVNMKAIRRIERNWISMEQGELIPISKSRYGSTRERYFHYMEGMFSMNQVKKEN